MQDFKYKYLKYKVKYLTNKNKISNFSIEGGEGISKSVLKPLCIFIPNLKTIIYNEYIEIDSYYRNVEELKDEIKGTFRLPRNATFYIKKKINEYSQDENLFYTQMFMRNNKINYFFPIYFNFIDLFEEYNNTKYSLLPKNFNRKLFYNFYYNKDNIMHPLGSYQSEKDTTFIFKNKYDDDQTKHDHKTVYYKNIFKSTT